MRLKSLFLMLCLGLFSNAYAVDAHLHPKADLNKDSKKMSYPGYCEIEIINKSYDDVIVSGVFDDGAPLTPFYVYSYGAPQYVSLYYYGYCHDGMLINVDTYSGYRIYSGYTQRQKQIYVVPYLKNQLKAEVKNK